MSVILSICLSIYLFSQTRPDTLGVDNFASMLLRALASAPMKNKKHITDALIKLYKKEGVSDAVRAKISVALMDTLDSNVYPVTCTRPDDKEFIVTALGVMEDIAERNEQYMNQMMTNFLDGDRDIRYTWLTFLPCVR